jgi:hypothetical protein
VGVRKGGGVDRRHTTIITRCGWSTLRLRRHIGEVVIARRAAFAALYLAFWCRRLNSCRAVSLFAWCALCMHDDVSKTKFAHGRIVTRDLNTHRINNPKRRILSTLCASSKTFFSQQYCAAMFPNGTYKYYTVTLASRTDIPLFYIGEGEWRIWTSHPHHSNCQIHRRPCKFGSPVHTRSSRLSSTHS